MSRTCSSHKMEIAFRGVFFTTSFQSRLTGSKFDLTFAFSSLLSSVEYPATNEAIAAKNNLISQVM